MLRSLNHTLMELFQLVQFSLSVVSNSLRPHGLQHAKPPCPSPLVMLWNHLILCSPLLPLPSIFPRIRVFFKGVSSSHQVAKLWSFSCSIRPYSEYSGLISFRIDWFVLLAVQGTLKGLLQHYGSKASFLWCSAFFMVQVSHPYMNTGKNKKHFDYMDLQQQSNVSAF